MDSTALNEQEWQKLQEAMDKPPKANKALKDLMNEKHDVWVGIEHEFYYKDCTDDCKVYVEIVVGSGKATFSTVSIDDHVTSFCIEKMTISQFNTWCNKFIADGFKFDSNKEEFNEALDNARDFVNNQFKQEDRL